MITLHHCSRSRSMRTLWLLNELGLDFELRTMPLDLQILRSPEYLAIHPLGRVPCLVDDGGVLFESGAIAQYLCETYDADGRLGLHRPPGDPERFEWLQWIHFAETIAVHGASLVQQRVFIAENERSPAVHKLESKRLEKALGVVERRLADREHILASGFSAADTSLGWSVVFGRSLAGLDPFPNARAYVERLEARPAFQAAVTDVKLGATPDARLRERCDRTPSNTGASDD
jgi:glutathione S-transferase